MVEPIVEEQQLYSSRSKSGSKLQIYNLIEIEHNTKKQIIKKCYPQTSFNPLDHPFTCNPLENKVHCHLYSLSFSKDLSEHITQQIDNDHSLGFVYWNDTLDQTPLDLDLNPVSHAKLEYIGEMTITLEQYKSFVLIDRFFTASVRSWDVNFFELLFPEYPVKERSSLNKKMKELENMYLPPILSWKDVRYSFFMALDQHRRPDLQRARQILDHLEFMTQYYMHFRGPENQEVGDSGRQKLKVDEDFVNAFKADPARVAATTVVQNLTNFSKYVVANASPLNKVDLLSLKLGKHSMQSRAMFYLEEHFDYPINKDEYILHLKSYSKRLNALLKGTTTAKERRNGSEKYEFYSFLSELRPYPIDASLSLQIMLAERTITQIRDNQRVLHFKENILKSLESGIMQKLGQNKVSYQIQIHQRVYKLLQKNLLDEESTQIERNNL